MANHVWTNTEFYNESDQEGLEKFLEQIQKRLNFREEPDNTAAHTVLGAFGLGIPTDIDIDWYHENIGPKWCFLEEFDGHMMSSTSAWGAPMNMVETMVVMLNKQFPNTYAVCSYEDEAYNFIGCALVTEDGVDESIELDAEEIFEEFAFETGAEVPEEGIWEDDEMRENFYEWASDWYGKNADQLREWHIQYLNEEL